jgi:hypothetical protein
MTPITAASPRGVTTGMLHAPQGDAFANVQALLDNGEGKHVDNATVHFSLSEMDRDGMMQRHKELSVKDTWNTMLNTWEGIPKDVDLFPPTLFITGEAVQGKTRKQHCKENKRVRWEQQLQQPEQSYWSTHQGNIVISNNAEDYPEYRNSMCPRDLAMNHPAGALLRESATYGCPTETGAPSKKEEFWEAVSWGPHASAMSAEVLEHFRLEAEEKVKCGQSKIVLWDDIKDTPPLQMKVSPIAAIPHKSKAFQSILDLSFSL